MPSPVNTLVTLTVQAGTLTTEVESVQKQERLSSSTIYEVHLQVGESREHRLVLLKRAIMRQLEFLRDLRVRTLRAVQLETLRPVRPLVSQRIDNANLDKTQNYISNTLTDTS